MHVRAPTEMSEGLPRTNHGCQRLVVEFGQIGPPPLRIGPFQGFKQVRIGVMEIGDVPRRSTAEFNAERIDQHHPRQSGTATHCHLRRDPAAEGRADEDDVLERLPFKKIEVEVGQVVDPIPALRQVGMSEAGMPRRMHIMTFR
jgi:hypothetical protein